MLCTVLRTSAVGRVPSGASIRLPRPKFSSKSGAFYEESGVIQGRDSGLLFPEPLPHTDRVQGADSSAFRCVRLW